MDSDSTMHTTPTPADGHDDRSFDEVWRAEHGYLVAMATRMVGDRAEAEDVVQDAFGRLARIELAEIDDPRGWLAVVVRRLCIDRIRSAYARRESVAGAVIDDGYIGAPGPAR